MQNKYWETVENYELEIIREEVRKARRKFIFFIVLAFALAVLLAGCKEKKETRAAIAKVYLANQAALTSWSILAPSILPDGPNAAEYAIRHGESLSARTAAMLNFQTAAQTKGLNPESARILADLKEKVDVQRSLFSGMRSHFKAKDQAPDITPLLNQHENDLRALAAAMDELRTALKASGSTK